MNVEGKQDASASAPASPTTVSTAAVQQAPQINSLFQLRAHFSYTKRLLSRVLLLLLLIYPPAIPHPFKCAAAAVQLFKQYYGIPAPSTTCGCSDVLSYPLRYYTHTPFGWSDAPGVSTPHIYHTPQNTLWVVGRAITHPGLSHPLGAAATCTLSPGLHKIPHPPQDTTPVMFLSAQTYHRGCVILCSLR